MAKTQLTNNELITSYHEAKQRGDEVGAQRFRSQLLLKNEGFARQQAGRWGRAKTDEDREDAVQAARMGILRAAELFDVNRGKSFTTFAAHQIRAHVQQWGYKPAPVKRPKGTSMPARFAERSRIIRNTQGREPTAEDLGVSEEQFTEWSEGTFYVELDAGGNDDEPKNELAEDAQAAKHTIDKMILEHVWHEAVRDLSERNAQIAEAIFRDGKTYDEVAIAFNLSKPTCHHICERVEARLRRAVKRVNGPPSSQPDAPPSSKAA